LEPVLTGDWDGAWNAIKGIFTGVWDAIWEFLGNTLKNIQTTIGTYIDTIKERFADGFGTVKDSVVGIFTDMWDVVKSGFVSSINWLIDKLNSFIKNANKMSSFLNPIGDGPQAPLIPNLGFGGSDLGGSFRVGDRGLPEIVTLPGGSSVRPLTPGDSGGGDTVINLNAPQNDPAGVAREIGWELTKRGL